MSQRRSIEILDRASISYYEIYELVVRNREIQEAVIADLGAGIAASDINYQAGVDAGSRRKEVSKMIAVALDEQTRSGLIDPNTDAGIALYTTAFAFDTAAAVEIKGNNRRRRHHLMHAIDHATVISRAYLRAGDEDVARYWWNEGVSLANSIIELAEGVDVLDQYNAHVSAARSCLDYIALLKEHKDPVERELLDVLAEHAYHAYRIRAQYHVEIRDALTTTTTDGEQDTRRLERSGKFLGNQILLEGLTVVSDYVSETNNTIGTKIKVSGGRATVERGVISEFFLNALVLQKMFLVVEAGLSRNFNVGESGEYNQVITDFKSTLAFYSGNLVELSGKLAKLVPSAFIVARSQSMGEWRKNDARVTELTSLLSQIDGKEVDFSATKGLSGVFQSTAAGKKKLLEKKRKK